MISGMIEQLTPRRVCGWAYDGDDPTASLTIRVREGGSFLTQIHLAFHSAQMTELQDGRIPAHSFNFEFPTQLNLDRLPGLTIEATRTGSNQWHALPRHLKIGAWPNQLPVLIDSTWEPTEARNTKPVQDTPFWSSTLKEASFDEKESRPVFVLGAARSGTTAMGMALEKGTRYQGFPEGHALDIATRLISAVNAHFERKDAYIPARDMASYHMGRIEHSFFEQEIITMLKRLTERYTTPFWYDKTPTYQMIASVPILAHIWPHAKFIFMKRRGLENMRSRIRKFSQMNFYGSCQDWALIMAGWRTIHQTIAGRFIELDQRSLSIAPESTAEALGGLLALDPSEVESVANVLRHERPESTGSSESLITDIAELNWTEKQIETFREICGPQMEAYGYTYDGNYYREQE